MSGTILPFVEVPFSAATIARAYERRFKVPFVKVRQMHEKFTYSIALSSTHSSATA